MTVAKTVKKAAKAVKATTAKVAKKIDKAVVEPVVEMFHSGGKAHKKPAKSRSASARAKKTKK